MKSKTANVLPAEIAGIPTERLRPTRDGSVVEYDRPFQTETEGVGQHLHPDARRMRVHPPGSEVAEAVRAIKAEQNKPRAVTRIDIEHMEQARNICAVQGKNDEAASCERMVHRMRAGFAISTRRQATPAPAMRSQTVARPRERSDRRSSSPSRAGPSDEGESSEPPPAGRLCANKRCYVEFVPLKSSHIYHSAACRVAGNRDLDRDREHEEEDRITVARLDDLAGTLTREVSCKHDDDHEVPHGWAPDGVCFKCGRVRGAVTRGWLTDGPEQHRSYVSTPAPKGKTPRLGDGSRKLVFTDQHGERRRLTDEGVVAA